MQVSDVMINEINTESRTNKKERKEKNLSVGLEV